MPGLSQTASRTRLARDRSIGVLATVARVAGGLGLIYLALILDAIKGTFTWQTPIVGLVVFPAVLPTWQRVRLRRTTGPLRAAGPAEVLLHHMAIAGPRRHAVDARTDGALLRHFHGAGGPARICRVRGAGHLQLGTEARRSGRVSNVLTDRCARSAVDATTPQGHAGARGGTHAGSEKLALTPSWLVHLDAGWARGAQTAR